MNQNIATITSKTLETPVPYVLSCRTECLVRERRRLLALLCV